ncbi:MAG: MarR family transcriptional regulator [Beijerinckiaceae bacterium]
MSIAPEKLAGDWTLDSGVGFLIRLIEARYEALYREYTAQESITPRQFGVLIALHQRGSLTLTELASAVNADRATLGEMVKRMHERQLVHRRNNGRDARSYEISLTARGRKILLELVSGAARLQDAFLAPVHPDKRQEFLDHLRAVAYGAAMDGRAQQ